MVDPNKDVEQPSEENAPMQPEPPDNDQGNSDSDSDVPQNSEVTQNSDVVTGSDVVNSSDNRTQLPDDDDAQSAEESWSDDSEELSLDDLGAAYARAAAKHDPEAFAPSEEDDEAANSSSGDELEAAFDDDAESEEDELVTPEAIIEGALFIGHPENKLITEQRLASLMREVTPEEVVELIEKLNQSYRDADQALRIIRDDQGYRMTISPEVEKVKRSFLGKIREAKLAQAAIEVLALVVYQPGISAQKVQDQRGRECGPLLSQLVRRQLLSIERKVPEEGGRAVPHYYPTERFLTLFELESLDDLPQVEEGLRGVT
ncbi:chromosome segregation and condensation protein, ScpB [Rhodopirellula maiorica SM1]|uniref:Chromosome segregation and condensation protein, ScpB n=1 Tax=Rhodopirellula maiorica SM1 TaxID=1265738 RepID=M5RFP6_9BACT|nr:SMC-Scp complex subunit ScpB [Rhodopirellula maiorica]EMI18195.1 chromosome segregation and condensation protein, ScpB [Rhodopirellula maiorica SM1]